MTTPSAPISITYSSPIDFRIGKSPPDGTPSNTLAAFNEVYASIQQLIQALINNCGIGPQLQSRWSELAGSPMTLLSGNLQRLYVKAEAIIPYGGLISLAASETGSLVARAANATDTSKPCHGFCSTAGGIAINEVGEVMLHNGIIAYGGLTTGANYWLSTTDFLLSAGPAVAAGNIEQFIGVAIDTTHIYVNVGGWIRH